MHKLLHSAHWDYLSEVIGPKLSDNPKPFFGYIKKIKRDSFGMQGLRDQGQIVTSSLPTMLSSQVPRMQEIHVTTPGVQQLLSNLHTSKAAGQDGISSKIFKGTCL